MAASEEHEGMDARTDAEIVACSFESPASFGELFSRHATTLFRYFVRRVCSDDADSLLGELFRVAFEKRATFDTARAETRPWLYGIASNLLARHRQGEARRLEATTIVPMSVLLIVSVISCHRCRHRDLEGMGADQPPRFALRPVMQPWERPPEQPR